jgi:uncharacterized membrane protein
VKTKHFIGLVLVLVGTNLFTFAASRYWTTQHVLIRAQDRLDAALTKDGLYDQVYPIPDGRPRPQSVDIPLAVRNAGGSYYWWNAAIGYWLVGVLLVLVGVGIMFYVPQKKPAA